MCFCKKEKEREKDPAPGVRDLAARVCELEDQIKWMSMDFSIFKLTCPAAIEHDVVYRGPGVCRFNPGYEERARALLSDGFLIRKTFDDGKYELWIKTTKK